MKILYMNTKCFVAAMAMATAFVACQNSGKEDGIAKIHLDPASAVEVMNTSSFVESAKLIALETTDESLIGEVNGVVVRDGNVYVLSGKTLFKFDNEGKYVAKIAKNGQGSDEYTSISDFDIDKDGNACILSRKKMLVYDWSGQMLSCKECQWAQNMKFLKDGTALLYYGYAGGNKHRIARLDDRVMENMDYVAVNPAYSELFMFFDNTPLIHSEEGVVMSDVLCDTIYSVTDNRLDYRAVLDYGGKNVPASFFDGEFVDMFDFMEGINEHGYVYNGCFYMESEKNYMCVLYCTREKYYAVADKSGNKSVVSKNIKEDVLLDGYPLEDLMNVDTRSFVSVIEPALLMEHANGMSAEKREALKEMIHYQGEEQNPVLYLGKMK